MSKKQSKSDTINNAIASHVEAGTSRDDIVISLFQEHALSLGQATKAVAKYMKDNGLQTSRRGINAEFNDWLVETIPTKAQVEEYIQIQGTPNMERHKSHYVNLADLTRRAFEKGKESK